jgi:hypothetical protein
LTKVLLVIFGSIVICRLSAISPSQTFSEEKPEKFDSFCILSSSFYFFYHVTLLALILIKGNLRKTSFKYLFLEYMLKQYGIMRLNVGGNYLAIRRARLNVVVIPSGLFVVGKTPIEALKNDSKVMSWKICLNRQYLPYLPVFCRCRLIDSCLDRFSDPSRSSTTNYFLYILGKSFSSFFSSIGFLGFQRKFVLHCFPLSSV